MDEPSYHSCENPDSNASYHIVYAAPVLKEELASLWPLRSGAGVSDGRKK